VTLALAGTGLAPLVTIFASSYLQHGAFPWSKVPLYSLIALVVCGLAVLLHWLLLRLIVGFEGAASDEAVFLRSDLPEHWVGLAILASAALSLFLELAIIRWQATVFPFFAFYKNLSLLSCFAGLGLGYSLGRRERVLLFMTLPLLCWQFIFMLAMHYGMSWAQFQSLYILPFREQLNMGLRVTAHLYSGIQTYFVLAVVFVLTALAFIPVGQLCGCLLERRNKLTGYGFNLLGSLAGVLLMFVVSAFWTPPSVWFLIAFAVLLCFYVRRGPMLAIGAAVAVLALIVLEWQLSPEL
jgi:hypothetical protein